MEEEEDDPTEQFFDSFDDFPFFDCTPNPPPHQEPTLTVPTDSDSASNATITSGFFHGASHVERRTKILNALKECERSKEAISIESSSSTSTNPPSTNVEEHLTDTTNDTDSSRFLVYLAGLVIKAIGFQFNLLVSFVSLPIWLSYFSVMFMIDPLTTLKRAKGGALQSFGKVWNVFSESFAPFLFEKLRGQKAVGKLALRFGWGFAFSVYICFVMFWFLVSGFVVGGFVMRCLVEEPIQMREELSFDYTRTSPVAFVPIIFCPTSYSGVNYQDGFGKSSVPRVLPPNHKLQVKILLVMPESDYNQRLGVFQVRVDFLSENGDVMASSRIPCMLRFKSHLIHYLETFLKSVPLLAGYTSETQFLNIQMRGLTEGHKPTSCLRVVLEPRAEYRSGAGIPEIYSASLLLESELPLLRRILWCWRKTIFVWISLVSFTMELMIVLLCCRPILIPRVRPRVNSTSTSARSNTAVRS